MKNKVLLILLTLTSFVSLAQKEITWGDLTDVKFERKYYPEYETYFLSPTFGPTVEVLDGQKITISGYFLDLYPQGDVFVLSKGPMASCFFCGVGGPETAIELHFTSRPSFKMDDIVTITGTFQLNKDDVEHFNYILNDCEGSMGN